MNTYNSLINNLEELELNRFRENIDTYLDSTNNDIAPFKNILNDMYAKDLSRKVKSA